MIDVEDTDSAVARSGAGLTADQVAAIDRAIMSAGFRFTANDVWPLVPDDMIPRNRRSLGARLRALAAEGVIKRVGGRVVSDQAHGQTIAVWRRV